ncbi:hypothetical protein DFJ74DRAFT_671279 [Hyaloraphidium curvatum]|nr:hypothetical protein DFJ74DRAFT_671279 [Hyaloraphidium curvatum]
MEARGAKAPPVAGLDRWNREKLVLVKALIELAGQPPLRAALRANDIVGLVRPLVIDADGAVQQAAALVLWMVLGGGGVSAATPPVPQGGPPAAPGADDVEIKAEAADTAAMHDVLDRYYLARRQFAQDLFSAAAGDPVQAAALRPIAANALPPLLEDIDDTVRELAVAAAELLDLHGHRGRPVPRRGDLGPPQPSSDALAGSAVPAFRTLATPPPMSPQPAFPPGRPPSVRPTPPPPRPAPPRKSSSGTSARAKEEGEGSGPIPISAGQSSSGSVLGLSESPPQMRRSKASTAPKKNPDGTPFKCEECGKADSPEWRRGPSGQKTLCNACGLRYARKVNKMSKNAFPFPGGDMFMPGYMGMGGGMVPNPYMAQMAMQAAIPGLMATMPQQLAAMQQLQALSSLQAMAQPGQGPPTLGGGLVPPGPAGQPAGQGLPDGAHAGGWQPPDAAEEPLAPRSDSAPAEEDHHMDFDDDLDWTAGDVGSSSEPAQRQFAGHPPSPFAGLGHAGHGLGPAMPDIFRFS